MECQDFNQPPVESLNTHFSLPQNLSFTEEVVFAFQIEPELDCLSGVLKICDSLIIRRLYDVTHHVYLESLV